MACVLRDQHLPTSCIVCCCDVSTVPSGTVTAAGYCGIGSWQRLATRALKAKENIPTFFRVLNEPRGRRDVVALTDYTAYK